MQVTDAEQGKPPSYDTLFGKIKQANAESTGTKEYCWKSTNAMSESCGFCGALCSVLCCCGFSLALPIAAIVIGSLYLYDCPIDQKIPIWLIVFGCWSIIIGTLCSVAKSSGWKSGLKGEEEEEEPNKCKAHWSRSSSWIGIHGGTTFSLLIMGTVWCSLQLYRYTPVKYVNTTSTVVNPLYCNDTVIKLTFGLTMAVWSAIGLIVLFFCLFCCCICFARSCAKDKTSS